MRIEEAYLRFLEKVNKNLTNDNLSADRGRFILLFNESQNRYVEWLLEKRNEDDIRHIQKLLVYDKRLKDNHTTLNHQSFALPEDFFSFSNIQAFARTEKCSDTKLYLFEIKQENRESLLQDDFNRPSFKYRETFYSFGEDEVKIYKDNFDISQVYLTYYRYPKQVDIRGYIDTSGKPSKDIDPEFDDRVVEKIILIAVKLFNSDNENLHKYQLDKDLVVTKH